VRLEELLAEEGASAAGRINGVVIGVVTNNQDPDGMGRVKLKFAWLSSDAESNWARIAVLMAGPGRGSYFLPEVDDEVLVAFEHGDANYPYVLGSLWNGKDKPPLKNDDGKNNIRLIQSRSGHIVRLSDEDGKEKIEIIDHTGKNSIVFDSANNTVTISADKDIALVAKNGKITLDASNIEITASSAAKIESKGALDLKATAALNAKGQTVNLN
jgi:uncharacterized protein involved in type VI secretion and phage assembly